MSKRMRFSKWGTMAILTLTCALLLGFERPAWAVLTQQQQLVVGDPGQFDKLGAAIAISGDTVVVGAANKTVGSNTGQGAAYVFIRNGTNWTQQAELTASDGAAGDQFGTSVAVTGDTSVVGAYAKTLDGSSLRGVAYVFVRNGTTWTQQAELIDSVQQPSYFGWSVSVSGDTAAVGAMAFVGGAWQAAAYIYMRGGATWSQQALLWDGNNVNNYSPSGRTPVSLSGNTVVFGATNSNQNQGAASVFVLSGTAWTQQARLLASDGALGDELGASVAAAGDTVVVGAINKTFGSNTWQGAAYVFIRNGTTWTQQAELTASDIGFWFGSSVALSGDLAIVGHPYVGVGANYAQGAAYAFLRSGSTWTQQARLVASDGSANDCFGTSVSVAETTVVVGGYDHIGNPASQQGAAYVFAPAAAAPAIGKRAPLLGVLFLVGGIAALTSRRRRIPA